MIFSANLYHTPSTVSDCAFCENLNKKIHKVEAKFLSTQNTRKWVKKFREWKLKTSSTRQNVLAKIIQNFKNIISELTNFWDKQKNFKIFMISWYFGQVWKEEKKVWGNFASFNTLNRYRKKRKTTIKIRSHNKHRRFWRKKIKHKQQARILG